MAESNALRIMERALDKAGGLGALAELLPKSLRSGRPLFRASVGQVLHAMERNPKRPLPAEWCPALSKYLGLSLYTLRPDIYPDRSWKV